MHIYIYIPLRFFFAHHTQTTCQKWRTQNLAVTYYICIYTRRSIYTLYLCDRESDRERRVSEEIDVLRTGYIVWCTRVLERNGVLMLNSGSKLLFRYTVIPLWEARTVTVESAPMTGRPGRCPMLLGATECRRVTTTGGWLAPLVVGGALLRPCTLRHSLRSLRRWLLTPRSLVLINY